MGNDARINMLLFTSGRVGLLTVRFAADPNRSIFKSIFQ